MPYVRVKDKSTRHEMSLMEGTFDEDAVTILDKDAIDSGGEPLPVKYHTDVNTAAANKSGQAANSKEK